MCSNPSLKIITIVKIENYCDYTNYQCQSMDNHNDYVIMQTITANLCIITMLDACIYLEDGLQESGGLTTSVLANNWDISKLGCAGAVGLIALF